ncbi:MAG: alpha/beta hydrolase [Phycisphaerae bacterium]|nr:alpha/beta hydrolase [Gemmatimonadaceae bacterium]
MVATTTPAPAPMAVPDSQMQAVLDELANLNGKPIETLTPEEARKQPTPIDAVKTLLTKTGQSTAPDTAVASADRTIPGPGGSLPVRVYTPKGATGALPVVVYYHGGGWVIANKDVYDGGARAIAKYANAIVVSVDYRLAPEHPFPAAHDDALATYQWVLKNAASIKGDPMRVALAGESAGGNLAVATAMAVRDQKLQQPMAIVAVYPVAGTDTMTASYIEHANAKPLNRPMIGWFVKHTLQKPADLTDPRINLVNANLAGLPPTTIINAQIDPLRTDGEMLAEKLKAAGVQADQKTFDGAAHEFFGMGAVLPKAVQAQQMAGDALKKAFGN